jgi:dTDP-4-amino-4,6-dideoxygalactose transaminase
MALTNNAELAARMALLRSHGITRDSSLYHYGDDGGWYYEQIGLGFNYRLTDLQAALGASQMARIDSYVRRRHEIAARYGELLRDLPIVLPAQHSDTSSAYHLYPIRIPSNGESAFRAKVFQSLREAGIGVNVHYIPVHTQPYYRAMGFQPGDFPEAERYYAEAISLPMYPTLTQAQQDQVISAVAQALAA